MYSLITATNRYEFDEYIDLYDFFLKLPELHFIVEFSKDSMKGYKRLYFPQDMYDKTYTNPTDHSDISVIEASLVELYHIHKVVYAGKSPVKPTER
jgi:hypothetical protein